MSTAAQRFTGQSRRKIWFTVLIAAVVAGIAVVVRLNKSPEEPPQITPGQ